MKCIEAVVLGSLSSPSLTLTLYLTLPSLGILNTLSSRSPLTLRTNILASAISSKVIGLATLTANVRSHQAITPMGLSTLWTWWKISYHWTLVLVEPLVWNIGPLPLWLLTTISSTLREVTFTSSSLEFTHSLLFHILPLNFLHMSHQSSNVHLRVQHSRPTRILKSFIQPGHKLAHLGPRISNDGRSIFGQFGELE